MVGPRPDHHGSSQPQMLQAAASAAGPPLVASPYPQAYLQYSQVIQGMPHYPGQVVNYHANVANANQSTMCVVDGGFVSVEELTCIGIYFILFMSLNVLIFPLLTLFLPLLFRSLSARPLSCLLPPPLASRCTPCCRVGPGC